MNIYQINAVVSLHTGNLLLNAKQAARRMHLLEKVEAKITMSDDEKEFLNAANETLAVYAINKPVQFKAGERIGYDGDIPKAERACVTAIDDIEEPETEENAIDEALLAAIAQLEPGNPEHWTAQGKPEIKVLGELLQRKVTGKERDAAFAQFKAAEQTVSEDVIADDLLDALAALDTTDDNNYEEDGTPKLAIISDMAGREITAAELNAALDAIDNTTEQDG